METKSLYIYDVFGIQDELVSIQSVIDKLQTLKDDGYTTASFKQDLVMYDPETEASEFEQYVNFYKD